MNPPSPWYPPRAGAFSRCLAAGDRWAVALRRWDGSVPVMEEPHSLGTALPWLLVPGLMWRRRGRRLLGGAVLLSWALFLAIHTVSLNLATVKSAAVAASVLHAVSASAVLRVVYPHWRGWAGLWRTALGVILLMFTVYTVGLGNAVPVFALKMAINGHTVAIRPAGAGERHWRPGDWVAYRLPDHEGVNMDRILAGPGDTIRFHQDSFEVNGRFFERVAEYLPVSGEKMIPAGEYFIWPSGLRYTHYTGTPQTDMLLRLSSVAENGIVGRPFRRWFWVKQEFPPLKPL